MKIKKFCNNTNNNNNQQFYSIDIRGMTTEELTKSIFNNPQGHFRQTKCRDCGYPGHWEYACQLLDVKWQKKFTKHAVVSI